VCVCVCVCTHILAHTACGVLSCEPRDLNKAPGYPEESKSTKSQDIYMPYMCTRYICIYVQ